MKVENKVDTAEGPLILLTDPLSFMDNKALAECLASHEVIACKAADAIDAVGYISDFTQSSFPALITIPKNDAEDANTVSVLIDSLTESEYHFSIFQYSKESTGERCISLEEIDHWLMDRGNRADS
jgi:hypothetical protein